VLGVERGQVERGQVWINKRSKRKLDILAVYEGSMAVRYQLHGKEGAKGDAWMSIAMLQEACELVVPMVWDGTVVLGVQWGKPVFNISTAFTSAD